MIRRFFPALLLILIVPLMAWAQTITVQLSWTAPTTNVDGTPITDLAGYTIYAGPTWDTMVTVVQVNDPAATSHAFDVPVGTQVYTLVACDTGGNCSVAAQGAVLVVPPSAATNLSVQMQ